MNLQTKKTAIANAVKNNRKNKGFSLPSVIVGSIIAAVLGTVAISSMWGSVDKAKIAAEKSTISEMKTTTQGVLEAVGGFPVDFASTEDSAALSRVSNLPTNLKYELILVKNGTSKTSDDYIVVKAYADSQEGATHLRNIVEQLYLDLNGDNTLPASTATGSKFAYDTTCSDSATVGTSKKDCFYISYVTSKANAPNPISTTAETGATAGTEINGTTALPAADSVAPLN